MIVSPNVEYAKGLDDSKVATELDTFSSLNIIDFYPLPHFGNFPFKKAVEKTISKYESELSLYPISNSQAILIEGTEVNIATK